MGKLSAIWRCTVLAGLLLVAGPAAACVAQDAKVPLLFANERTTIRDLSFAFEDTRTFEEDVLRQQIATDAPGFTDRLRDALPFLSAPRYRLDRIELQKDVVRLRRFYQQNGFLTPRITYADSELDTTRNAIDIVFTVIEGPPILIEDVGLYSADSSYFVNRFDGAMRNQWNRFYDRTTFQIGDRYTDVDLIRIQDQVLSWLKDRGYAFARFDTTVAAIDSTYNTANISFYINTGLRSYFDEVEVVGNERVSGGVVRRELPFKKGDLFSNSKLVQGQRELFGLNLFRVALADVPPQEEDGTVNVRFRVREARLRYLSAQTGYTPNVGLGVQGQWTHRNFSGGGRTLTLSGTAETGFLASGTSETSTRRLFRAAVALRQPYLFTTQLSGIVEPFIQFERDPLLEPSDRFLELNRREFGVTGTLLYEILSFRTVSLQYRVSRARQDTEQRQDTTQARDAFNKSVLTLSGTFGKVNNFLNPRRGFLVRPFVEPAGGFGSGLAYYKTGAEVVGYLPLTRRVSLGARLTGGRIWTTGSSRGVRRLHPAPDDPNEATFSRLFTQPTESRFDPVRFYAGGSSDVRGWSLGLIGPKINRTAFDLDDDGAIRFDGDLPRTRDEEYEPVGGLTKLAGNVEVRFPLPRLGSAWRAAAFLDFGQISTRVRGDPACVPDPPFNDGGKTVTFFTDEGEAVPVQCGVRDDGKLALGGFKYGVGAGIRYETPVGYIRLDLAFKLNPDDLDLQTPRNAFLFERGFLTEQEKDFLRRFNLHLSLGQAF